MGGFAQTVEIGRQVRKFVQLTSLATAVPFPGSGSAAMVQAEGQDVRYRADGIDPTSSVGTILANGESIFFLGDVSQLRFIETAASAKLNIHVFK